MSDLAWRLECKARHQDADGAHGVAALLVAAAGRIAMWQPIDTAPRNRNILLSDGATVSEGGWLTESEQTGEPECGAMSPGWWSVQSIENPSHWMPLPDPPLNQNSSEGR